MSKIFSLLLATATSLAVASTSLGAVVTFTLDTSTPGEFSLFAEASSGDNFGIASYGALLTGNITAVDHLSPSTAFANNGAAVGGAAGFTLLRSMDGNVAVGGSQDTVVPTPHLIRGFGQAASSFADKGLTPLAPAEGATWDAKLLLATGTYTGDEIGFNETDAQTFSNIFTADSGVATTAADLMFLIDDGTTGGTDPILAGMPASGTDLSAALQAAFKARTSDIVTVPDAIMVMNDAVGGTFAELGVISDLVTDDSGVIDVGLTPGSGEGKYNLVMSGPFSTLAKGTVVSGNIQITATGDADGQLNYTFSATVPEPSTVALTGLAMVGLVGFLRRRK